MDNLRIRLRGKVFNFMIFIGLYISVPVIITLSTTGVIERNISDEIISGRSVTIEYKNLSQKVDINKFIIMVMAKRLELSTNVEVIKAECIMVRSDIYRLMGSEMNISSQDTCMDYLTEKQMKSQWGENYEENYNLISDCVAVTNNMIVGFNGAPINAKYCKVSSGTTTPGNEVLGEGHDYLAPVACPDDINATDYLTVTTFGGKELCKKIKAAYDKADIKEDNPMESIQILHKDDNGYIYKLQVGNVVVSGQTLVDILGINSPVMQIDGQGDSQNVKITTKGSGCNMGLSIFSANIMAENGKKYEEILSHFYPGTTMINE